MAGLRRNVELYERRVQLGLTQTQVAELLTAEVQANGPPWDRTILPREYVSRLESGRITWPNAVFRAALRKVLGVDSDAALGLYCQRVGARAEEESMRRRNFLATLPAVALTAQPLGELVAAAMAQPVPPPRRVGLEQVEQVWELIRQVDTLDHRYGGGLVNEMLAGQVRWAVGLCEAYVDRKAEPALYSAVGNLCSKAGWAAHDSGLAESSGHYYRAALRCAEQADDWRLRAGVLFGLSTVAAEAGRGDEALTFAEQGRLRADRLPATSRAWNALCQAQAHAMLADREATLAAIGRAEDEVAAADPSERLWGAPLDAAELHANCGRALRMLTMRGGGRFEATTVRLREAVAAYPDAYARSRALTAAELSTVLMCRDEVAEAIHYGNQVLDAAPTMQSARLRQAVRIMHAATSGKHAMPEVDDFRRRIAHTLAN
jgi:transcriptional regulator with XRE-family HTH domain